MELDDIGGFDPDDFHFERVAVTPEQIVEWKLQTRPTKTEAAGNRHAKVFIGDSVELDAIPIPRLHPANPRLHRAAYRPSWTGGY